MIKFLLLRTTEDTEFKEIDILSLKQQIAKINTNCLKIGLDLHAGFNIPTYNELGELLLDENRKVEIFFSLIDQRTQSADLPYSPIKIFVKKENKNFRKRIYPHRSIYISQIPLKEESIVDNYKEILKISYQKFSKVIEGAIKNSKTIGEFVFKLNCLVLSDKLDKFKNIKLKTKFDIFNKNEQNFHPISIHENQHIIYIALHKSIYDKKELKYLENKFKNTFSKENKYIILPINPNSYFSI